MINIEVTCDKCGKDEGFTPVSADEYKLSEHLDDIGFTIVRNGLFDQEREYCKECAKSLKEKWRMYE